MPALHPFPSLSLHADGVLWVGLALVLATLMGESVFRFLRWPRLVGYTAAGLLIAAGGSGLQAMDLQPSARAIVDAALAMLLFEIGHRVNLRWLRANPWLLIMSVSEWALALLVMWGVLEAFGLGGLHGLAAAAALACTAPAAALRIAGEFNSRGQVTERLLLLAALGAMWSILALGVFIGWLGAQTSLAWWNAILQQIYAIGGAVLAASALAWAVNWVERHFDFTDEGAALLLVGLILLVLSVTRMLHWSTLLTPLLAGLVLRVRSQRPRVWPRHFGTAGGVLVVLLFLILGLSLNWAMLVSGLVAGLVLALGRSLAKLAVSLSLGCPSGLSWRQSAALGLTLNPAAGVSFVLLLDLAREVPGFPQALIACAFAALVALELGGSLLARWALGWSGDIPRPRKQGS